MKLPLINPANCWLLLICFYGIPSFAQERLITCGSERNADNSISIYSDSKAIGDYTVKIIFTALNGYTASTPIVSNIFLATTGRGKTELIKLQNKTATASSFQYRYQYFPGRALNHAPDSAFVYLVPASAGNAIRISKVSSVSERLGQKRVDDYIGTGFVYHAGDTICASRAGLVYNCNDDVKEGEKNDDFYKSGRNRIRIQQRDETLCTYDILAPIQLLVSPGDEVYPGQPLAVFNKQSEKYMVLLSAYYLDAKKLYAEDRSDERANPSDYIYLPTHFFTGDPEKKNVLMVNNTYIIQHPKEIIAAELRKKEKKKLGLN